MYKKVDSSLNFVEREKETLKYWQDNNIVEQSFARNAGQKSFAFYDGPPTANGKPHIGHVLTRVIKDLIPRYRVMKGYSVLRKAGWDTHGLPVELEVEKQLGLDGKQDIEKFGIEPFIKKCKESVWKYKGEWENLSQRVAYWADMKNPYITYDNNYIESEWWAFKEIDKKGLLYKGHKIVPYCPRCGTALSSHEVAQGYKDVEETSVVARFLSVDQPNTYYLAWTTTPWTLPSNVALCVNPDEIYVTIKQDDKYYILARDLVINFFENCEIVKEQRGKELEGKKYIPLFAYQKEVNAYRIVCDGYVTLTDGTGIVHIAPAFGEEDSRVGKKYDLPLVQMVDTRGKFVKEATGLADIFCKDADKLIIADLRKRGLLHKELLYKHSYPFCWRCDTPLIYYARKSWFIKVTDIKKQLIESNNSVNWLPESIKEGRMGNFLENVIDWGVSRERYWGTPLPIWVCDKCGKTHIVGSRKELDELSHCGQVELHRPYIDKVTWKCDCGGNYVRTPEVADCWFDSGSMPYAQFHYPFENVELFEKNFPADFISEAIDQTRGWFYTLLAVSTLLFGKASFKNCVVLGLVGDKDGVKMSKHKGNVVDPWVPLEKQGTDAVRWYFYTASQPYLPSRFYDEAVSEAQRKFLGTFWNTYAFFVLYADIDKFNPSKYNIENCKLSAMDKWILSKVNSLVRVVDEGLEHYQITDSARAIEEFSDLLSNWYVRRCRERYWGSSWTEDKQSAYVVLHKVLVTLCKVSAPFVPFITEEMYLNLVPEFFADAPKSVHLCDFPAVEEKYIDKSLEKGMDIVRDIVALGRNCRNASNIKNRQPLSKMYIVSDYKIDKFLQDIISEELNVKEILTAEGGEQFISYELKPQLKTLGPKYGKLLGSIRQFLTTCNAIDVVDTVRSGKTYVVTLQGQQVEFTADDLLITTLSKVGYATANIRDITVALDTTLSKELVEEGLLRELISKIQTMRKECGFVVTDHIGISLSGDKEVVEIANAKAEILKKETLADAIGINDGQIKELDINGHNVKVSLVVIK
ncbi:MAG: isoleucine--tRNA ligase [Clostridia bacterium]